MLEFYLCPFIPKISLNFILAIRIQQHNLNNIRICVSRGRDEKSLGIKKINSECEVLCSESGFIIIAIIFLLEANMFSIVFNIENNELITALSTTEHSYCIQCVLLNKPKVTNCSYLGC